MSGILSAGKVRYIICRNFPVYYLPEKSGILSAGNFRYIICRNFPVYYLPEFSGILSARIFRYIVSWNCIQGTGNDGLWSRYYSIRRKFKLNPTPLHLKLVDVALLQKIFAKFPCYMPKEKAINNINDKFCNKGLQKYVCCFR